MYYCLYKKFYLYLLLNLKLSVMATKCFKDLKLGDYFTLKDFGNENVSEKSIYVRGEYDFSSKSYSCYKFADVNRERFFKGSKLVFVDFEF